ncbi:alpha/beta-hydrolase, partial [Ascobolus immersus RN42]
SNRLLSIIAVHGLNGHPENTWRHNDGHFWLTESLVDSLKPHSVSIWTYGYDASRFFRKSSSTVRIIAETFLRFLSGRANFLTSKTIIFIGHSLGGLVIKKAILLAKNNYKDRYPDLYPSIYGAVFLGTPHQGSALANYGTNLMRLF